MDTNEGGIKPAHPGNRKCPYLLFWGCLKTMPWEMGTPRLDKEDLGGKKRDGIR
jgi:hypothetical protein